MSPPPSGPAAADDDRSVAAKLCDIVRYAPLAIVLDGPSMLPQLAEQGKQHVRNAKALGPVALRRMERQLRANFGDLGTQAADLLRASGLVTTSGAGRADDGDRDRRNDATAAEPVAGVVDRPGGVTDANGRDASDATAPEPGPPVEALAIPDYDSLSAMQVVNRLPGLAADELVAVRDYEAGHRGRKTVLNRIAQLKGPSE
jgi:hypothetical protein